MRLLEVNGRYRGQEPSYQPLLDKMVKSVGSPDMLLYTKVVHRFWDLEIRMTFIEMAVTAAMLTELCGPATAAAWGSWS